MKYQSLIKRLVPLLILAGTILVLYNYRLGLASSHYVIDDMSLIDTPQLAEVSLLKFIKNLVLQYDQHIDFYPVRDLSYWVDINVFGAPVTWGSELTLFRIHNFVLFSLINFLLYFILVALGVEVWIALIGVLLWSAHPIHAELFMWVTSRKDLLSLLFAEGFVLSVIALFRSLRYRVCLIFFCLVMFILSIFSKSSLNLICIPLGAYVFLEFLNKEKSIRNIKYELVLTVLITCIAAGWSVFQGYFYSQVNDMRFGYEGFYRMFACLTALGRSSLGLFWPSVNAVDVFNWGDWGERQPILYPIFGFSLWISWIVGFLIALKRKKNFWLIGLLAIIGIYMPISGLIFPHRNFYSVRYFEGVFVILFVFVVWAINGTYERIPFLEKNRFRFYTSIFGIVLWTFFLWLSSNESKNWSGPLSVVEKALVLDPENPSLLAQKLVALRSEFSSYKRLDQQSMKELWAQEKFTQNRLDQICKPRLETPLGPQGDLCWMYLSFFPTSVLTPEYHGQIWPNRIAESEESRNLRSEWFLDHSKWQSSHVFEQNDYLIKLRKSIEKGVDQKIADKIPVGTLNTEFNKILSWSHLCSIGKFPEANKVVDGLLENSLVREELLFSFSQNYGQDQVLQNCLASTNTYGYLKRSWVQRSADSKWNNFHKFVSDGAPGIRYGCGNTSRNGYDCGSNMDQAAMINLYAELYWVTMEPKFLREGFKFAFNGNSNCYVGGTKLNCGEGKALGQMVLALLKLFLVTGDSRIRMTFSQIINPFTHQFEINDEWDAFEIYRSARLVYWLNTIDSSNFNSDPSMELRITSAIVQKFPNLKSKIEEWQRIIDCTYGIQGHSENHCNKADIAVEVHDFFTSLSLKEMLTSLPDSLQTKLKFSDLKLSVSGAMSRGRIQLANCQTGKLLSEQKAVFQDFIEKKYNENPKPFYYAEEGDNFAPMVLSYYNFLKVPESMCARWELNSELFFRGPPKGRSVVHADNFVRQPRPVFVLPQLNNSNEFRIWILNNSNVDVSFDVKPNCVVFSKSKWKELTIKSHDSHTMIVPLAADFKKEQLVNCVLSDSIGGRHFLMF